MATTFKDYYETLGVPRTATEKEIHSAFRKLARKFHPDINHEPDAEARFKEINEAHEVLGDPAKRSKYDELGPRWQEYEAWERSGRHGQNPFEQRGGNSFEYRTVSPDDLEDLFGNSAPFSDFFETFFGGSERGSGGTRTRFSTGTRGSTRIPARRGEDVEGETEISLEEAFNGTTRTVELNLGGRIRRVEVRIPAGIAEGARVRAAGQGSQGSGGAAAGDLYVRVRIHPHPTFTREGANLTVKVPVPLHIALVGGAVPVPTLRGTTVELTVPEGTQNGARLRLRGLGMPHVRGHAAGDLIATADVRLPVPVPEDLRAWAERVKGT
jgi:DnaJ-class molecular chaperone